MPAPRAQSPRTTATAIPILVPVENTVLVMGTFDLAAPAAPEGELEVDEPERDAAVEEEAVTGVPPEL